MTKAVSVRRVGAEEAAALIEGLADVLVDCVEGGASVGFMLPLPRAKAHEFWRGVAEAVARRERLLLVAEDVAGRVVGTVQLIRLKGAQIDGIALVQVLRREGQRDAPVTPDDMLRMGRGARAVSDVDRVFFKGA